MPTQNLIECKRIFQTKQNYDGYIDKHKVLGLSPRKYDMM